LSACPDRELEYLETAPAQIRDRARRPRHTPEVYADPDAQVTTPFDVLVNQRAEDIRGTARQGPVGVAFADNRGARAPWISSARPPDGADKHITSMLEMIRTKSANHH
jgi:hypothetical protein